MTHHYADLSVQHKALKRPGVATSMMQSSGMELSAHGNLCTAATFASLALSPLLSLSLSLFSSRASNALSLPRWQRRVSPQIVNPKRLGLQACSQDVRRVR